MNSGNIFIGGVLTDVPTIFNFTNGSLEVIKSMIDGLNGFRGCLHDLKIGNQKIQFEENSILTANIQECVTTG